MIDTNIFLDVLAEREPFYANSKAVLDLCESKKIYGFLSASSVTDIFYLIRRQLHSVELAYKALGSILDIAKVLTVTNEDVLDAYIQRAPDCCGHSSRIPLYRYEAAFILLKTGRQCFWH